MRKPSPSGVALVFNSVTAEPASGSDMAMAISPSPASSGGRKRFFCSGEPKAASVRMAPKLPAWTRSTLLGQKRATSSTAITASIRVPP